MEINGYQFKQFKSFLLEKNVPENEIFSLVEAVNGFIQVLEEKNETINSFSYGDLIEYKFSHETVLYFFIVLG